MKPDVSVVIPVYNEEKYIARVLETVTNQTIENYEVIVVDNNCTDRTIEIAKQFNVRVVKEETQGMIPARQRGYGEANADLIVRTDADSRVPRNWLEKFLEVLNNNPQAVGVAGSLAFPDENKISRIIYERYGDLLFFHFTRLLMGHFPLVGPNHAVRKSAWEKAKVHLEDKLVHEDMDLSCHISGFGEILYRPELKISSSMRRWRKNFLGTAFEYHIRYFRTIWLHHPWFKR